MEKVISIEIGDELMFNGIPYEVINISRKSLTLRPLSIIYNFRGIPMRVSKVLPDGSVVIKEVKLT
jgi:hypothetical protein